MAEQPNNQMETKEGVTDWVLCSVLHVLYGDDMGMAVGGGGEGGVRG
jgi:hypothetical protein